MTKKNSQLESFSLTNFSHIRSIWISYILLYPAIFGYFLYYVTIRVRKIYFIQIIKNIISLRHILKFDIQTNTILENSWDKLETTFYPQAKKKFIKKK